MFSNNANLIFEDALSTYKLNNTVDQPFVNKYDKHRLIFDGNDTYVQWMHSRGSKMMYYDWSVNPLNPVDIHQNIIGHTAQKEIFKRQIQI